MACSNHPTKPSVLLFSFLSLLILSFSDDVLGSGYHKRKHAQAPAPELVVAAPPEPVGATPPGPALVLAPSPVSDPEPAEAPTQDCSPYAEGLLECLDFLEAGSSSAQPGGSCCTDLRDIAKEDVSCLCSLLMSNQNDFGFQINTSRVLSLPHTCSFTLPTSSKCNSLAGSSNAAAGPGGPGATASQGSADIVSPPLPPKSVAATLPITIFTIAAGIVFSMLSLIA